MGLGALIRKTELRRAIEIARNEAIKLDTIKRWMHWTFIYQDGSLIEWGTNLNAVSVQNKRFGYKEGRHYIHAETVAFKRASGLLDRRKSWQLLNVRLRTTLQTGLSCPCPVCLGFIKACGCSIAYFTVENDEIARLNLC